MFHANMDLVDRCNANASGIKKKEIRPKMAQTKSLGLDLNVWNKRCSGEGW